MVDFLKNILVTKYKLLLIFSFTSSINWTGPAGFSTTNTAQPVMGSTNTYTSAAVVRSFGRDQSGNYTCTATVSSVSSVLSPNSQSETVLITTGKIYLNKTAATFQ